MDCFRTYFTHVHTCNVSRVQSTTPNYSSTTKYYSCTTPYYKVLCQYYSVPLQYYSSTTPYYKVLQSTTYYKVPLQYYKVLLRTTKNYATTTLYYKVLRQYYSVLLHYYKVLLRTTKYFSILLQYNPFQSLQPLSSFIPLLEWQTQRGGCCWSQPGPGSRAPPPELGKENTDHGLQDGHNREGGKGKKAHRWGYHPRASHSSS